MAYTAPRTWSVELVDATEFNQQIRDNFLAIAGTTGVFPSPHMTAAVIDSGGLTISAGGLAVTGASSVTGALTVTGSASFAGFTSTSGGAISGAALTVGTISGFTCSGAIAFSAGGATLNSDSSGRLVIGGILPASAATAGSNGVPPAGGVAFYLQVVAPNGTACKIPAYNV